MPSLKKSKGKSAVSQLSVTPLAGNGSDLQIPSSSREISTAVPSDHTAPALTENVASPNHVGYPPDQQLNAIQPRLQDPQATHLRNRLTPVTYQAPPSTHVQTADEIRSPQHLHSHRIHPSRLNHLRSASGPYTHRRKDGQLSQLSQPAALVEPSTSSIQDSHLRPAHELIGPEHNSLAVDVVPGRIDGLCAPPYPLRHPNEQQLGGSSQPTRVLFTSQPTPNHAMLLDLRPSASDPSLGYVPGMPDPPLTFSSLRTHHSMAGGLIAATASVAETEDDPDIPMDCDSDTEIVSVASPPPTRGGIREGESGDRYRLNEKNARVRKATSVSDLRLEIFGLPPEPAEGKKKRQPSVHKTCQAALEWLRYYKWQNADLSQKLAQSQLARWNDQMEMRQSLDQANRTIDHWRRRAEDAEQALRTTPFSEGWNIVQAVPDPVHAHSNTAQPEHELYHGDGPPHEYNDLFLGGSNEWLAQSDDKPSSQNLDDVVLHRPAQF